MRNITWNDKPLSRQREAWLLLIHGDNVHPFLGKDIPGVAAVVNEVFCRDGKWSNTTYDLAIDDEVTVIQGHDDFNTGRFIDGLRASLGHEGYIYTWGDLATALGVTVASTMMFLRSWRPTVAQRIDNIEAALDSIGTEIDTTITRVSFGGPSSAQIRDGYWTKAIVFSKDGAEIGRVTPDPTDHTIEWTASGGVTLIDFRHDSGYHGGYVTLVVAGAEGSTWEVE